MRALSLAGHGRGQPAGADHLGVRRARWPRDGRLPLGPSTAAPNAPTGVTATAGKESCDSVVGPGDDHPGRLADHRLQGHRGQHHEQRGDHINVPLCTTACGATVPNLTNGATYRIQVRAESEAGGLSKPGTAPGTLSRPVESGRPVAPTGITATAGGLADLTVDASVGWNAPAPPAVWPVEAWRVTAYETPRPTPASSRVFVDEPAAPSGQRPAQHSRVLIRAVGGLQGAGDRRRRVGTLSDTSSAVVAR